MFIMENNTSKEGQYDGDLEKGRVSGELGYSGRLIFGTVRMNQLDSERNCNGSVTSNSFEGSENVNVMVVNKEVGEQRSGDVLEKKVVREKPKAMSAKKPPKPPRPPRGLSLDSTDQKLIKELHELAKLKRARIERMKALKKAKEAKATSSKNHLFATLLTILFCLVLLFQGISSRTNRAVNFQGSPISSGVTEDSIISVQHYPTSSLSNVDGPGSESHRLVEPASGLDTPEQVSRAVG